MDSRSINFPGLTVGENAYRQAARFCGPFGKTAVIIGGRTAIEAAEKKILSGGVCVNAKVWYGGECSVKNAELISDVPEVRSADMIFAVGGGKAIDLGKLAADLLGKPLFAFPTAASSCSAFTPFAEIYPSGGRYSERLALKNAPIHVFLDTVLLAEAPAKYLRSAMGQTCAAYFDTEISTRYKNLRHLNALGLDALKRCAETVFEKGDRAFFDNIKHITSREFEDVVYAVTASAGFSQTMLAHDGLENGFDGLSRAVCNALVSVGADLKRTRGEIMSFGALIALLYDGQIGEYTRMIRFCEKTDMPFILRDFGLGAEAVYPLADRICRDPVLLNYPCKIDPVKLKTALSRQI